MSGNYLDLLRSHDKASAPDIGEQQPSTTNDALLLSDETIPASHSTAQPENSPLLLNETHEAKGKAAPFSASTSTESGSIESADENSPANNWFNTFVNLTFEFYSATGRKEVSSMDALNEHLKLLAAPLNERAWNLDELELESVNSGHIIRQADADYGDLVEKALTVVLYAIKMGHRLQLKEQECCRLLMSAVVHHIGMALIDAEIRHKTGRLDAEEREQIRQAPTLAAEHLKRCNVAADVTNTVQYVNERFDGSGPLATEGTAIPYHARILGLLSTFESLIHFRTYRKRLLPRDAIRELLKNNRAQFDPALIKALIDAISLYPVGCFVQLNSGDIGQVVFVHSTLPLRPKVMLSMDRHGNDIKSRQVNLQEQPNLQISKCMYSEELVELRADSTAK
ncbi:MAG: HD domain-containing phosphohydrolase [Mariprofundaceae bacterium]